MFTKKLTDQQIKEGISKCDLSVYKYLDKKFRSKTNTHVKANSGNEHDADELYNDVILQIHLNIENGKYETEEGKFGAYFMRIMKNKWIDKLRHRNRKRQLDTTELDFITENQSKYEEQVEPNQELELANAACMHKHIDELKEQDRTILKLFYFDNLRQAAIAEKIGMTAEYVKQRIFTIRGKLKKELMADPNFAF